MTDQYKTQAADFLKLKSILETTRSLFGIKDIDDLVKKLGDNAKQILNADSVVFFDYSEVPPVISEKIMYPGLVENKSSSYEASIVFRILSNARNKPTYAVDATKFWRDNGFTSSSQSENSKCFWEAERIESCVAIFLKVKKQKLGILFINYRLQQNFSIEDKQLIEFFASQVEIAVQNIKLLNETERKVKEINLLREITEKINTSLDIKRTLELILKGGIRLLNMDSGVIHLLDNSQKGIDHSFKFPKDIVQPKPRLDQENTMTRSIIDFGEFIAVPDISLEGKVSPKVTSLDIKSLIGFPVKFRNTTIGVLYLNSKRERNFSQKEIELLNTLAQQANSAIQNARLYEKRIKDIESLREINREITTGNTTLSQILKLIVARLLDILQAISCIIRLYDEEEGLFLNSVSAGLAHKRKFLEPRLDGASVHVKSTKRPLYSNLGDVLPNLKPIIPEEVSISGISSVAYLPLLKDKHVIGILYVEWKNSPTFRKNEKKLLHAFADQASIAISSKKIFDREYQELRKKNQSQRVIEYLITETSLASEKVKEGRNASNRDLPLNKIFKNIIKRTVKIFGVKSGHIALANYNSRFFSINPNWTYGLDQYDPLIFEIPRRKVDGELIFDSTPNIAGFVIEKGIEHYCPDTEDCEFLLPYEKDDSVKSKIVMPLIFQNQTFGVFTLDAETKAAFSKEDQKILKSIALQMGMLISRYYNLVRQHFLSRPFKDVKNLDKLICEILGMSQNVLDINRIILHVPHKGKLVVERALEIEDIECGAPADFVENLVNDVFEKRKIKTFKDFKGELRNEKSKDLAKKNHLYSIMIVPLLTRSTSNKNNPVGILTIFSGRPTDFTLFHQQVMGIIAHKAAQALKNSRLISQLDSISGLDKKLNARTEEAVLKKISDIASNLLEADLVVLYQYNPNVYRENFGFSGEPVVSGKFLDQAGGEKVCVEKESFVYQLLNEEKKEFFIENFSKNKLVKKLYEKRKENVDIPKFYIREKAESAIVLKLVYGGGLLGVLFVNFRYVKTISAEIRRIASIFASKAQIAINNIRRYEELSRIHSIGNQIARESQLLKPVLQTIVRNISHTLNAEIVILHQYDSQKRKFTSSPIQVGQLNEPDALKRPYGAGDIQYRLIASKKDYYIPDVSSNDTLMSKNPDNENMFAIREGIISCAALRLKVHRKIIGTVFINYRRKVNFSPERKRVIEILVNQAELAISNANLIREEKKTITRITKGVRAIQKSGNAIAQKINTPKVEESDILQPIIEQALNLMNVRMGYIGLINPGHKQFRIVACSERYNKLYNKIIDDNIENKKWVRAKRNYDIFSSARPRGDYQRFADNPHLVLGLKGESFSEDKNVKSALRVLIALEQNTLGMIVLESNDENAFLPIDAYTAISLANQAAMALQNLKMIRQLRKLREIDKAILEKATDLDQVLGIILTGSLELVLKKHGDISLCREGHVLEIVKSYPDQPQNRFLNIDSSICGQAVNTRDTVYVKNVSGNSVFIRVHKETLSELAIPLEVNDKIIGVLNIESDQVNNFTKEDIDILELFSGQAAIAINMAMTQDQLIEKEKEANMGYVTRESVHWVGNKIGPIPRRVENIVANFVKLRDSNPAQKEMIDSLEKDLAIIGKGAKMALSIKSDLIESGSAEMVDFDLIELIEECIQDFRKEYEQLHFFFKLEIESFEVSWNQKHIYKLFTYLFKNSIQAIDTKNASSKIKTKGEINVHCILYSDKIKVKIHDNGCGIKEEHVSQVFNPFFTTKGADEGTGVGLTFCRRTMNELKGAIYIDYTGIGRGTSVTLEFPKCDT